MTEIFCAIVEHAAALGVRNIGEIAGCWEVELDDAWWFALNGHGEPTKCSKGTEVPPFTVYVEFNGWPAGLVDPHGGVLAAGDAANEDTFIAAIRAATESAAS